MLKWTVAKRDAFPHMEAQRRSSMGGCTTTAPSRTASAQKPKRRRSSTGRRRSSTGGNRRRNSLCLDLDKENRFTSTPIKDETFQADAFRDLSNLTPKGTTRSNRRRSACVKSLYSPPKKKKACLEQDHISQDFLLNLDNTNYFKPFEAVDSHIEGSYHPSAATKDPFTPRLTDCGCQYSKTPVTKRYAPTLPTFALDYSPTPVVCNTTLCQPKIDHVNDFLQRISLITSPEELKLRLPGYRPKPKPKVQTPAVETPSLVKRFIDSRRFAAKFSKANDSSFINDLSLDKIVDAILDSSVSDSSGDVPQNDVEDENECNRTKEENFINEQQCRNTSRSSIVTTSTDSGFRSSTTELSHDAISITSGTTSETTLKQDTIEEKTMINLEGTFNERCVDACRKRPNEEETKLQSHRLGGPQLKKQKCIRQKRPIRKLVPKENKNESDSDQSDVSDKENELEVEENATYVVTSPEVLRSTLEVSSPRFNATITIKEVADRGTIDLDVQYKPNENEVTVSVFRCADLRRQNGQPVNAYIKVALGERCSDGRRKASGAASSKGGVSLQRTAVQPESSAPFFGHTFRVPLSGHPIEPTVLYVEAWHRDRTTRRSEFLGCTSFAIKDALTKNIKGTYKLSPQWSDICTPHVNINNNNHLLSPVPVLTPIVPKTNLEAKMSETLHTSIDELIAGETHGDTDQKKHKAALSEQQKVADENLFLRYLELDPVEGPEAAPALAQRKASGNKTTGRTPFTMTRTLRRAPKSGFGFSVVWTHPPRIERVERNLPADKAGIQPGDYLIFVDKHNVVMMPEIEVLDLIRSLGSTLTLETFRRDGNRNGSVPHAEKPQSKTIAQIDRIERIERLERTDSVSTSSALPLGSITGLPQMAAMAASSLTSVAATSVPHTAPRRPSTVCSTNTASVEYSRKKLHLPQVTFSSERPTTSAEEARRKAMYQLIAREQQYTTSMQFAATRYVQSLLERKDLIAQQEHRTLFQNSDELLRISEEIIDHLIQVDGDYHTGSLIKIYAAKLSEITSSYKRYCSGIQKADCVLANLLKNPDFSRFITIPAIPRRRPDLTSFIHKPLEHYREILKLFNMILTNTKANQTDEYNVVNHIVHELQTSYREMTSQAGLMEPVGEGRPLLSVQDLETRLVFTKCKPFVLSKPGRQWIFGGDLSRVEGRTVRQYWALLFSDILLFAKVSRDRVLFILEEPLPLAHISDMYFNVRKKENEFRIIVEPGATPGNRTTTASSPTVHCGPDLSRTPRKHPSKRCIILRTPTVELKAVWQNLLQRQIFHIGASNTDGSAYSSPLESPDCCLQPITASVVTLQSAESLSRHHHPPPLPPLLASQQRQTPPSLLDRLQQHTPHHQPIQLQQQQQQHHHHPHHHQGHTINNNTLNNINNNESETRKRLDELIEHKCKQLEKSSSSGKSNAIHLEQWMKGQFNGEATNNNSTTRDPNDEDHYDCEEEDDIETWTDEQIRKRSEELKLIDPVSSNSLTMSVRRTESRCEDVQHLDDDQSPSRSTNTTESQVTVRSSAAIPETVSVCKNCHRTCYSHTSGVPIANGYKPPTGMAPQAQPEEDDDDWRPLMLMGLSAVNPAACFVKLDPFSMPVPKIAVLPPTPTPTPTSLPSIDPQDIRDLKDVRDDETECNCHCAQPAITRTFDLVLNKSYDNSPDDSPVNDLDEQPYHSLHSSNLTLRRFGTVSSLERFGSEEETYDVHDGSENSEDNDIRTTEITGIDNEGFNNTLMTWTARAGSFVAAKMAFLEKLPEYLKNDIGMNREDIQEEETSGGTSGEEIWGTPTSGGELDDPLSSPQYDEHQSPNGDSLSSNEDTELMMDELLMTPPVTSSNIRGLLPRRTLEPLMEEEFSDTYTSTSSTASSSPTPTEPSVSPEQGSGTGGAADESLHAAATRPPPPGVAPGGGESARRGSSGFATRLGVASLRSISTTPPASAASPAAVGAAAMTCYTASNPDCGSNSSAVTSNAATTPCPVTPEMVTPQLQATQQPPPPVPLFIKRSDSYQKIIEAADDSVGFFTRFRNRPSMKYLNIERIPPSRGVKFLEFFNVRRERKIYETFPGGKHLIKVFSREGDDGDGVPTSYSENPELQQRIKQERQLDRRFWKQLSKRRNSNSPNRQANLTSSNHTDSPILSSDKHQTTSPVVQNKAKHIQPLSA